jgi:GAF domain-containing protein
LRGKQGHAIGVLYAIDTKPRSLSNSESKLLESLAELVVEELDALLDSALLASEAEHPTDVCVGSVN